MRMARQCTPHFLFPLVEKKTGRARSKRKGRFCRAPAPSCLRAVRVGDVRWCLRVCGDLSTGAAGCRRDLAIDSRSAGAAVRRVARTYLTSFSFCAFRFATRCPGTRRGRCSHQPLSGAASTAGQRKRKSALVNTTTSQTTSAPSATGQQLEEPQKSIACPKTSLNRRLHRYAGPRTATLHECAKLRQKAAFSFGPCTARFLFHKREKKMGGCIAWPSSWQNPAHSGGFFAQDRIPLPISIRKPAVRLPQSPRLRSKRSVESPSNG